MANRHCVLLIPGFFGFESFGDLRYFVGVKELLERFFLERGEEVVVMEVHTSPTASIRHRAAKLLEVVAGVAAREDGPLHILGHSTGGLDARLAIAPTASLPTNVKFDAYHRVHSMVTISTPHYGTPTAATLSTFMGRPILRVAALALAYSVRFGKVPMSVTLKFGKLLARADELVGIRDSVLDTMLDQLLSGLSPTRRKVLVDFLTEVAADQSLVFQLTPDGIDLFNATTLNPSDLRYGSVVTLGPKPKLNKFVSFNNELYTNSMYGLYVGFYQVARRMPRNRLPTISGAQGNSLIANLGRLPRPEDNDGLVPTLSQVWGEVIFAVDADHFDTVGHFSDRLATMPHVDWLPSGSTFDRYRFEALWRSVAEFLLRSDQAIERKPDMSS